MDGSGTNYSPRELLTGVRSDAETELRIPFGAYVQANEPYMDNTMKPRTKGAIALLPTGNEIFGSSIIENSYSVAMD